MKSVLPTSRMFTNFGENLSNDVTDAKRRFLPYANQMGSVHWSLEF